LQRQEQADNGESIPGGKVMRRLLQQLRKDKKGAAFVEYALLIAGVALIGAASVSTFGHKTKDLIAMTAGVLPGAHVDDNAPILSGKIIETAVGTGNGSGGANAIALDIPTIVANSNTDRLDGNLGDGLAASTLVLEPN
jgi:pilus assembly protein Flp/PilA